MKYLALLHLLITSAFAELTHTQIGDTFYFFRDGVTVNTYKTPDYAKLIGDVNAGVNPNYQKLVGVLRNALSISI